MILAPFGTMYFLNIFYTMFLVILLCSFLTSYFHSFKLLLFIATS